MLVRPVAPRRPANVTRMRVVVDFDRCKSNALCMAEAPEVFEVRDDGFLYILQDEPPEALVQRTAETFLAAPAPLTTRRERRQRIPLRLS